MKAEVVLEDMERQCRELIDSLPQAVWTSAPDGRCEYVNHYVEEFMGVPVSRLLGWGWLDYLHPEDREPVLAAWRKAIQTGSAFDMDYRARDRDGNYRWGRAHGIPVRDGEGRIVRWVGLVVEIDDRKQMEDALRASEEFNRHIVESSLDCIKILDLEGRLLSMNHAGQQFLGITDLTPYVGRSLAGLWSPEDRPKFEEAIARARAGGVGTFQGHIATISGDVKWFDTVITPLRDGGGKPERLLAVSRDITELKRAEDALREGEERFRLVADAGGAMVFDISVDYCRIDAEYGLPHTDVVAVHGLKELLGYELNEVPVTVDWWISQIHPDDLPRHLHHILECLVAGKDHVTHYRVRHKQGHYISVESVVRVMRDDQGCAGRFVGGIRDITERRTMEEALRESEEKFRSLAESASSPIGIIQGRKFIYANAYLINLSGYSPEEFYALDILRLVHPDDQAMIADRYARRIAGDPTVPARYEYRMITKSGELRWMDVSPVRIDLRGIPSIIGNAIDITDRKRTAEALQKANEELETRVRERTAELQRSNDDLEKFAYITSHDLQEPLRMIASYVGLLAEKYRDQLDAEAKEFIQYAVEGARQMSRLIKAVLGYSRISTQGRDFEPTETESVLAMAVQNLKPAIEEAKAQVTHDPLPEVMADGEQLMQVFQNLIGNAIKFRKDMEPPRVHVSAAADRDGQWVFSVRDNGIGMEAEYFERIFVPFQRLHARGSKYPGTGIGLAIVKRIVERHGGQVCVDSAPGQGSTFYFTLPTREIS